MLPPWYPWVPSKDFSQFGPAVWPAIANINMFINMSEELYDKLAEVACGIIFFFKYKIFKKKCQIF